MLGNFGSSRDELGSRTFSYLYKTRPLTGKADPTGTTDQDLNNVVRVPDTCGEEEKMETPQMERKRQKWPGGL